MKISRILAIAIGLSLCLFGALSAAIINVPDDQPTIQAGIDAASYGDTVLVEPGHYHESMIQILGKVVTVAGQFIIDSLRPTIESTIIDADFNGSIFRISGGWNGQTVIGFTLINGSGSIHELPAIPYGGAFSISGSGPIIKNNIIRDCSVDGHGGAIWLEGGHAIIQNNTFENNEANKGGAIFLKGTDSSIISHNLFYRNSADSGGGVYYFIDNSTQLYNCTFYEDSADEGGGIYFDLSSPTIQKVIIAKSKNGGALRCNGSSPAFLCSNLIWNTAGDWTECVSGQLGVNGNICMGPQFCDTANGDYGISYNSPCSPSYSECGGLIGAFDVNCDIPPNIISVSPSQNASAVSQNSDVSVIFNADMDPTSFNDSTFIIHGRSTGLHAGTYTYDSPTKTVIFTPYQDYAVGEVVSVILNDNVLSSSGVPLDKKYAWSFTVGAEGGTGIFNSHVSYYAGINPHWVCIGDFNNDTNLDLSVANRTNPGYLSIINNDGNADFSIITQFPIAADPISCCGGDLNNDGFMDIAAATSSSDNISILLNNGDNTFMDYSTYQVGYNPFSVCTADLNGDGYLDLAVANDGGQSISVLINLGDGSFASQGVYQVGTAAWSIVAVDIDNDYDNDLITGNGYTHTISIFINGGEGEFYKYTDLDMGNDLVSVSAADLDNDSFLDIIVTNAPSSNISIVRNNSGLDFADPVAYTVGANPYSLFIADYNGDGYLDVATCNMSSDNISVLLNNGDGTLEEQLNYMVGSAPRSIYAADVDNDDDIDIVTANKDSNEISVLLNMGYVPYISEILIDGHAFGQNIINNTPLIEWNYNDQGGSIQYQYEIAVGTDDDWAYAEMWNPAPVTSSDTFVVYNGSPLVDGQTYYLRLRVDNGEVWSGWYATSFHMNSIPSIPVALSPVNDIIVDNNQPTLWVQNSIDGETDDTLTYEFVVANDTAFGEPDPIWEEGVTEGTDSTGWIVTEPLNENWKYFWNCRAFDQYEYSDWGDPQYFWVNAIEEAPGDFGAYFPPDTDNAIITDMLTGFWWGEADEPDPLDSVYYTLYISVDSNFNFVNTIDSIWTNLYTLTADDSLEFGTHYWWKVKATDNTGRSTYSTNIRDFQTWMLGDVSGDLQVNILDVTFLINYLYKSGAPPWPIVMGDIDGSCSINILDVTYLINYLYKSGPAPLVGCE